MSTPFDDERLIEQLRDNATYLHGCLLKTRGDACDKAASRISEMRALLDELREALAVLPVGAEWNIIGERGYRRDDLLAKIAALKAGQWP